MHKEIGAVGLAWLVFFFAVAAILVFVGAKIALADEVPMYRIVLESHGVIEMLNPYEDMSRDECFASVKALRRRGHHARCVVKKVERQVS